MSNEAAERLLDRIATAARLSRPREREVWKDALDAALAAERKATVERIRAEVEGRTWGYDELGEAVSDRINAILDAEAAR